MEKMQFKFYGFLGRPILGLLCSTKAGDSPEDKLHPDHRQ